MVNTERHRRALIGYGGGGLHRFHPVGRGRSVGGSALLNTQPRVSSQTVGQWPFSGPNSSHPSSVAMVMDDCRLLTGGVLG